MRTVRLIFWVVFAFLVIAGSTATKAKNETLAGYLLAAFVFWWFLGMFISRLFASQIITSIRCKGCGLETPAVDRWQIGSYTDHRERHYLFAKNLEVMRIGHINCPQCSSTIML